MDIVAISEEIIVGLVVAFVVFLCKPIYRHLFGLAQKPHQWLVRRVKRLIYRLRVIHFEVKAYCTKKRRMVAVTDLHISILDGFEVDISQITRSHEESDWIEGGTIVTFTPSV